MSKMANIESDVIDLYNSLLKEGVDEKSYYKLITLMDNLNINRDNFEEPRIFNGIVKIETINFKDGYDMDCD